MKLRSVLALAGSALCGAILPAFFWIAPHEVRSAAWSWAMNVPEGLARFAGLAGERLLDALSFGIPLWWILVGLAIIIALVWVLSELSIKGQFRASTLAYLEDYHGGWLFRWEVDDFSKRIRNLRPICRECRCDVQQIHDLGVVMIKCPDCGTKQEAPSHGAMTGAEMVFVHRSRTGDRGKP